MFLKRFSNYSKGITLVELTVVIAILGVFAAATLAMINPFRQLEKSADSKRLLHLEQIKNALDLYSHDNNCFPTSLPVGEWSVAGTIYMKNVPRDPNGSDYIYVKGPAASPLCPRWSVVVARLSDKSNSPITCPSPMPACVSTALPVAPPTAKWACAVSGTIICP